MKKQSLWLGIVFALGASALHADVKPSAMFSDKMVLQRNAPIPVWGTASPNEAVTVTLSRNGKSIQSAQVTANAKGEWRVDLKAIKEGAPLELAVKGKNEVKFSDVLAGEVWICSGQSNMHWTFDKSQQVKNNDQELAAANSTQVRFFNVPKKHMNEPQKEVEGKWMEITPQNVMVGGGNGMSALGWFFGRHLEKELKIPIGLINTSVGGTAIELWSPNGTLYNAMIAPVAPFAARGAIWYQGESNVFTKDGASYEEKMQKMVTAWRKIWGTDLAFYFVHLAPFAYTNNKLPADELPKVWEAQARAAKSIPNAGMVVITDTVDNINDIHPKDKQTVADRLARLALAKTYGKKAGSISGPLFESFNVKGDKIVLQFEHASGLKARDGKDLDWFTIAGADKKFVPAKAEIKGKTVVVSAAEVKEPVAVRFGWDEKAMPNLVNEAGLPAAPFRTDNW